MAIKKISNLDFVEEEKNIRLFNAYPNQIDLDIESLTKTPSDVNSGLSSVTRIENDFTHTLFEISYPANRTTVDSLLEKENALTSNLYSSNRITYRRLLLDCVAPDIKAILNRTNGLIDDNERDISLNQLAYKDFEFTGEKHFKLGQVIIDNLSASTVNLSVTTAGEFHVSAMQVGDENDYGYVSTPSVFCSYIGAYENVNFDEEFDKTGVIKVVNSFNFGENNITANHTSLSGTFTVDGTTRLNNDLIVKDGEPTSLGGTLNVKQAVDFDSTLNVDDGTKLNSTLEVDGTTKLNNNLIVKDGATTTLGGTLNVKQAVDFDSTLEVDGTTRLNNTLEVGQESWDAQIINHDINHIHGTTYFGNRVTIGRNSNNGIPFTGDGAPEACLVIRGVDNNHQSGAWSNTGLIVGNHITDSNGNVVDFKGTDIHCGEMYGIANRARWADVAECYESDKKYEPGTLVQFGGDKEITIASTEVNAVVSTNPAYLMNYSDNMDENMLPIALLGRIPVKVVGDVKKFDKIYLSKVNGFATSDISEAISDKVIGRALENKKDDSDLVECIIKLSL